MIFSSFEFIFMFLPIVFIGYFLLNKFNMNILSKWYLVFASVFFYWYGEGAYFLIFVGSVLFNYVCGLLLGKLHTDESRVRRKLILILGLVINCAVLGYFKYTNFFLENLNYFLKDDFSFQKIMLPLGISFYTFMKIAYLVDSYRGETKEYSFLNYLLFITFFPQLLVGPIVHHKQSVPQFENKENRKLNIDNISKGLFLFFMGACKKLIIADNITPYAQIIIGNYMDISTIDAWFGAIGYTVSFYFDMSGYADMAIGLGLMFNINIPINFNSPYKSRNFAEYWRRWHITLSNFLGDYVFRSIKKKNGSSANFYWAILVTFLVSGFWHGAGWTFIVWGLINGVYVIVAHMMEKANIKFPFLIAWGLTFIGSIINWVLFVVPNFSTATIIYKKMFLFNENTLFKIIYTNKLMIPFVLFGLVIALFMPNSIKISEKFKMNAKYAVLTIVLMFIALTSLENNGAFLYFRF